MVTSKEAIQKIKDFEGFRDRAYKPVPTEKYYTIGYGHCGPDVGKNDHVSQEEADMLLKEDVEELESRILELGIVNNNYELDALVSFCYNVGFYNFKSSTLLKYIRMRMSKEKIQGQFKRWVYAGGKKLKGLEKRRDWEAKRYYHEV